VHGGSPEDSSSDGTSGASGHGGPLWHGNTSKAILILNVSQKAKSCKPDYKPAKPQLPEDLKIVTYLVVASAREDTV